MFYFIMLYFSLHGHNNLIIKVCNKVIISCRQICHFIEINVLFLYYGIVFITDLVSFIKNVFLDFSEMHVRWYIKPANKHNYSPFNTKIKNAF